MDPEAANTLVENASHLRTTYLGTRTSVLGVEEQVGIDNPYRNTHVLAIGATGTGKTQAMIHAALQDIHAGRGICFINPKGDAIDQLLTKLPDDREDDIIYINPADPPVTPLNPLEPHLTPGMSDAALENQKEIIVGDILAIFKRQSVKWGDQWPRILSTLLRAHLDLNIRYNEHNTLADVLRCVTDTDALTALVDRTDNPTLRSHLIDIRHNISDHALLPLKRRIQDFMGNDVIRRVIDATDQSVDFGAAVTEGKIILVDVQRGKVGRNASPLIGSLVITQVWAAAQSRSGIPVDDRERFSLFIDEAKHYMSESSNFDEILSEAREYRLSTWIATQYLTQLDTAMQRAVMNNCRTKLVFQPEIADDGAHVAKMLIGVSTDELQQLESYRAYLQLPTNAPATAFTTMPPWTGTRAPDEVAALKTHGTKVAEQDRKDAAITQLLDLGPGDNAGKQLHTLLLQKAKRFLEQREEVVRVNLLHQDVGTERPDGEIITRTGVDNLEAEVATLSKPARVLTNAVRAIEQDRKVVFVTEEQAATRLQALLENPTRESGEPYMADGEAFTDTDQLEGLEYRLLVHTANGKIRYHGQQDELGCPELDEQTTEDDLTAFCLYRTKAGHCELLETPCVIETDD